MKQVMLNKTRVDSVAMECNIQGVINNTGIK
jgi:hypothetical protein